MIIGSSIAVIKLFCDLVHLPTHQHFICTHRECNRFFLDARKEIELGNLLSNTEMKLSYVKKTSRTNSSCLSVLIHLGVSHLLSFFSTRCPWLHCGVPFFNFQGQFLRSTCHYHFVPFFKEGIVYVKARG